ncbi:MAG: hypothetical protein ACLQVI_25355 [Polyangiaceae bacterium]
MPLLNVRLSPDDARRAAELREEGVQISDVVREAIRAEYLRRRPGRPGNRRPSNIVKEILAALPDPAETPLPRVVDPADRHAVRRHIAAKLRDRRE